jgi:D-alanine-D-alanine ligase-like ATP-grasp enzyme
MHYGPGEGWKFYTRAVDTLEGLEDELALAPQIYQQQIDRSAEVRVTVVDGRCYSVAISCEHLPPGVVDVRQLDYASERKRFFTPKNIDEIESWSTLFTTAMGLGYAGIDWAVDVEGRPYFLEANSCGAFKWFEQCGAGDITKAIAEALLKRCF